MKRKVTKYYWISIWKSEGLKLMQDGIFAILNYRTNSKVWAYSWWKRDKIKVYIMSTLKQFLSEQWYKSVKVEHWSCMCEALSSGPDNTHTHTFSHSIKSLWIHVYVYLLDWFQGQGENKIVSNSFFKLTVHKWIIPCK